MNAERVRKRPWHMTFASGYFVMPGGVDLKRMPASAALGITLFVHAIFLRRYGLLR